jgi:Domain of unknown function (DUF4331)
MGDTSMISRFCRRFIAAAAAAAVAGGAAASSHREAPFITTSPKVDGTDFYLFSSYESGRAGYVTLIANFQPFQEPGGGPNYYQLDPNALYEIMVDNNGDGQEDLTFQFRFQTTVAGLTVPAGTKNVPVPLANIGPVTATSTAALNTNQSYTLTVVSGNRRTGTAAAVMDATSGGTSFTKPIDNIGAKSVPAYATYAGTFVHNITIPGCNGQGRVFVGQRQDGFVLNLGEVFDLVNITYPAEELYTGSGSARNLAPNKIASYNVSSIALEIPAACLTANNDPVIGAWSTASLRQAQVLNPAPQSAKSAVSVGPVSTPTGTPIAGGAWTQVSRLGMPLTNEVIIGLPDKDLFNASEPKNDAIFADYVTNPTLPVLLQTLFGTAGVKAPNVYPRTDLEAVFLTGITGVNQPAHVTAPSEMLRLNTSTAVTAIGRQSDLGVLGADMAGFPNGRRPIDDVVDIELRVAMGALLKPYDGSSTDPDPTSDASRQLHYTDGAEPSASSYLPTFPYLNTPLAGSPTSAND